VAVPEDLLDFIELLGTMINRSKLNDIDRDLVEGMEGFLADLKSDTPILRRSLPS
jgi:hypothetical protein